VLFKSLFRPAKKRIPEDKLPALHSFVDVTVTGRSMRSVSVESIGEDGILVGDAVGRTGERAAFIYQNANGKFRFGATIAEVKDGMTRFALPDRIEAVGTAGSQKRSSVRMDVLLSGQYRLAPSGMGVGEFQKASIRDISRGGCALILDRQCKVGQMLEVRMTLKSDAPPMTVLGEVMRSEQIPTSGKFSHGVRFHGLTPAEGQAILDFINRKQTELRNRGLA
jgi:hypothetical protein